LDTLLNRETVATFMAIVDLNRITEEE